MKKLFLSLAAIVGLFAVSCTTDATSDVQVVGEEGVVNFTLQAPTLGSRAINDGKKATELTYAVYDAAWTLLKKETVSFENGSLVKELSLRLVKNKTYNFVFWAQAPGKGYYTANLGNLGDATVTPTVTVNYAATDEANDDTRDAFFGKKLALTVNGTVNETVYLKRPFAQINFGTADTADAKAVGLDIRATGVTTKFTAQAYTTLNLANGTVDGLTTVTYAAAALPSEETTFTTKEGDTYDWLAMNYLLWPDPEVETKEMSLATCTMTISATGQTDIVVEVPQAPARRNWRTNLVGSLLTEQGNIKVEIKPVPEDEYNVG
ncbi:MAG: hypothetical protein E7140_07005, partial [Rikenellaceae bacterium]|nr:hypothetical protein [Rikenellaceae bacterium]